MEISPAFILESVGLPALTDIARLSAGAAVLDLLDWHVDPIAGGLGNPVSVGLYRVAGNGLADGNAVPWSAILKVIQSPANVGVTNFGEAEDPTHWNYWKRELLIYRSSFLNTLPEGIVAPRFFGAVELPGDIACLWLEDVIDAYRDVWPLERYALAARHLGRLNGTYAGDLPALDYPWLARRRLRQWRDLFTEWQLLDWEDPRVRVRYPAAETGNMRRVLEESEEFLLRLERIPQTLCHGDAYPTNFKSRHTPNGEQTVALDWALAHAGPIGYDLAPMLFGAYLILPESRLEEVDSTLFAAYLAGLRDSGFEPDSATVRFGYAASAVLLIALFQLMMLYYQIEQGESVAAQASARANERPSFEGAMADIAVALRDSLP